jgi:hypothetical protein
VGVNFKQFSFEKFFLKKENLGVPLSGPIGSGLLLLAPIRCGIFCPALEEPPGSENTATLHSIPGRPSVLP